MSDAQTLALIEALERRVANLEILEDPIRICRLINDVASDASQVFTQAKFVLWDNSEITLTLTESGYLWWGYQFSSRCDTVRTYGAGFRVFLDGVGQGLRLRQGYDVIDSRETHALVGRSDSALAAGIYTVDVRVFVVNVNDALTTENLTGYAFWTRE